MGNSMTGRKAQAVVAPSTQPVEVLYAHALAVSSQKGGVGKTTTCLSLGAALVELGLRVLLVDLDPQAHLTQALGVDPEGLRSTIGDALLQQAGVLEVSRSTSQTDLDLAPANRGLLLVEKILHATSSYEYRLRQAVQALVVEGEMCYYDLVLYDCPPSFGPLTVNALSAAGGVITPLTCDFFARQSSFAYLKLLEMVRQHSNPSLDQRLLVTMFDKRTRLSRRVLGEYRKLYDGQRAGDQIDGGTPGKPLLFDTIISMDARLRESPGSGRPVTAYARSARSAEDYRSLAREVLSWMKITI